MAKETIAVVLKTITVKHNGKFYGPTAAAGAGVSLPSALAEKLIASGEAVEATGKKAPAPATSDAPVAPEAPAASAAATESQG